MNDKIKYINYDETLDIYRRMIDASDGGFEGGYVMKEVSLPPLISCKMIYIIHPLQISCHTLFSSSVLVIISMMVISALLLLLELISCIKTPIIGKHVLSCAN